VDLREDPDQTHLLVVGYGGSNKRVLEVGCSTGYVSRALQERGCRVTGIELDATAAAFDGCRPAAALGPLRRAVAVEELLIHQLRALESMSPDGFMRFRDPLAPASGFQSTQFREIEALSGGGEERHLRDAGRTDEQRATLARRLHAPSLYDSRGVCLRAAGLDFPEGAQAEAAGRRIAALLEYTDQSGPDADAQRSARLIDLSRRADARPARHRARGAVGDRPTQAAAAAARACATAAYLRSASVSNERSAAVISPASATISPAKCVPKTSLVCGLSIATTGNPAANASARTRPCVSVIDGNANASAAA